MNTKSFHESLDDEKIAQAITAAELRTSGEIRVFISEQQLKPGEDVVARATQRFHKLGMTNTRQRNAVLLYFAPKSRRFAIVGDEAIHRICGQPFWEDVAAGMRPFLVGGEFTGAILHGVHRTGEILARHFPRVEGDQNELSDRVERE